MEGLEQGVDLTLLLFFNYSGYYVRNRWCVCGEPRGEARVEGRGKLTILQVRENSSPLTAFERVHQLFLAQTPTETLASPESQVY